MEAPRKGTHESRALKDGEASDGYPTFLCAFRRDMGFWLVTFPACDWSYLLLIISINHPANILYPFFPALLVQ